MRLLNWLITRKQKKSLIHNRFSFFEEGFHGDRNLLELVDYLLDNCDHFVETGTNVGSTLAFVARTYPHIECLSCEPDKTAFQHAVKNTQGFKNIQLLNMLSQEFLDWLIFAQPNFRDWRTLFWLDAHGYGFEWPLKKEISLITHEFNQGFILIDDFKVPGKDIFLFDQYKGQVCSYEFVKDALNSNYMYQLIYPNYTEHTSPHHPLIGWGLLIFGDSGLTDFPKVLQDKILHNYQW